MLDSFTVLQLKHIRRQKETFNCYVQYLVAFQLLWRFGPLGVTASSSSALRSLKGPKRPL